MPGTQKMTGDVLQRYETKSIFKATMGFFFSSIHLNFESLLLPQVANPSTSYSRKGGNKTV